jgi:hypothetical protein
VRLDVVAVVSVLIIELSWLEASDICDDIAELSMADEVVSMAEDEASMADEEVSAGCEDEEASWASAPVARTAASAVPSIKVLIMTKTPVGEPRGGGCLLNLIAPPDVPAAPPAARKLSRAGAGAIGWNQISPA